MDYLIYEKYHHRTYEETNDQPIKKKIISAYFLINWVMNMCSWFASGSDFSLNCLLISIGKSN